MFRVLYGFREKSYTTTDQGSKTFTRPEGSEEEYEGVRFMEWHIFTTSAKGSVP